MQSAASESRQNMDIKRCGSQPSAKGPAEYFTARSRSCSRQSLRHALGAASRSSRARTAWHTHPLGQTLIVTAGCGRPALGRPIENPAGRRGPVPRGRKALARRHGDHGHDARRHPGELDGKVVDWMEQVSDEQYRDSAAAPDDSRPNRKV